MIRPATAAARSQMPPTTVLVMGVRKALWSSPNDTSEWLSYGEALARLHAGARPLLCHGRAVARRLGVHRVAALDVLELFAFVRPARFCVPTALGLAETLLLPTPSSLTSEAATLRLAAQALLAELVASPGEQTAPIARVMAAAGWPWGEAVLTALGQPSTDGARPLGPEALRVWTRLKEWEDRPAEPLAESWLVESVESRARLIKLLGDKAEPRPQQLDYASHVATAFGPRERPGEPRVVLAEAGTGIGKTLGYIAPATVWAQKNKSVVWISTFTRNLQRQLDRELDRAYPERPLKARKVVVRKGRENLICLLNYEEATLRAQGQDQDTVALGLTARWLLATRDGDMIGGDFPAWLASLLSPGMTIDLTDTRGECIYAACRHFRRCFIERSIRRARQAEIVVANHALVMIQAARGEEQALPTRYVFDEAHQLFDAADNAFSVALSARETADLRRWLRGPEDGLRSRRRGLRERLGDLIDAGTPAARHLDEVIAVARSLPAAGWRARLRAEAPQGVTEQFLAVVWRQVVARNTVEDAGYSLEADLRPPVAGLLDAGETLAATLTRLVQPLRALTQELVDRLDAEADKLDTATRQRIEGLVRSLRRRALDPLNAWLDVLAALARDPEPEFIDWLAIDRQDGQDVDVGLYRHWLDPMRPFADIVLRPAHGVVLTSATLREASGEEEGDWLGAEWRTGVRHLAAPPLLSALASPFDYGAATRVLIITDVRREDTRQVAAAYRELFLAAGGGALGLFTAIQRLRAVYEAIAPSLEDAGLRLLAQHVDALDVGTLVDIFRSEENSCLLGTDAVRDGVDVPGRALRLIVFDRVPWPRPTILHRARRALFTGRAYDEMLIRLRLKQAYGRLIRRADDRGVFVMLDRSLPSRLTSAFPATVPIERVGLSEAIPLIQAFIGR